MSVIPAPSINMHESSLVQKSPNSACRHFRRRSSKQLALSPNECDPTILTRSLTPGRKLNPWKPKSQTSNHASIPDYRFLTSSLKTSTKSSSRPRPVKLLLHSQWILLIGPVGCKALKYLCWLRE
eukprot:Protomagalhaensia_sp_Gyna_25__5487@NODE_729_length_2748_cov_20_325951_g568_i0_p3_GENE_NODE_729_length_2748_cov_20_325951_g568_i0NODE_729_length_2748_cov_20_325951_g568_i0_p3_ORF_typecomplete_len125_score9_20_NODE_729_length_2748_cov_20_325951_g568_i0114488